MARPKGTKNSKIPHVWSDEEKNYLKEIVKNRSRKEIYKLMNERFEYNFSLDQVIGAMKRYKLNSGRELKGLDTWNKGKKGYIGANRTSFKKGNIPHNHKPIGTERVKTDGYTEVKVDESGKWRLKSRVLYEKYNGIELDRNEVVIFADKDKNNFKRENLIKVTRNQLKILNQNNLLKENAELTETGINIANILIKLYEIRNRK